MGFHLHVIFQTGVLDSIYFDRIHFDRVSDARILCLETIFECFHCFFVPLNFVFYCSTFWSFLLLNFYLIKFQVWIIFYVYDCIALHLLLSIHMIFHFNVHYMTPFPWKMEYWRRSHFLTSFAANVFSNKNLILNTWWNCEFVGFRLMHEEKKHRYTHNIIKFC